MVTLYVVANVGYLASFISIGKWFESRLMGLLRMSSMSMRHPLSFTARFSLTKNDLLNY
jgi:hypothetical protein